MNCIAEGLKAVLQNREAVTMCGDYDVELFAKRTASGEMALSMKGATGWETILLVGTRGDVLVQRTLFETVAATVAATLKSEADKAARIAPAKVNVVRCPHWKSIKRAYAIARECGLNTRNADAFRAACSRFLCREIESRDELRGSDWEAIGTAIKCGELAW